MTVKHTLVSLDMRVFALCSLMELHRSQKYAFVEMDIGVALQKKKKGVQFLARSIVEGKYLFKIEEAG